MARGTGSCSATATPRGAAAVEVEQPKRLTYREAMTLGDRIPEGRSGPWRIERFTVSESDAKLDAIQSLGHGGRHVRAGTYTQLIRDSAWGPMMSDTPDEMRDHIEPYLQAEKRGGRCLVHGLGLGMVTQALLSLPQVSHLDVVEQDADVIALVAPSFQDDVDAGRLTIHHDDCFTKKWPPGTHWTVGWSDVWEDLSADNLPQMAKLNRSFGRRCDFHGCWGQEHITYQRDRERRAGSPWV